MVLWLESQGFRFPTLQQAACDYLTWAKWGDDREKTTTGISLMLFHLGTRVFLVKNGPSSLEFRHLPGYNYYRTALSVAGKKKKIIKLNQKGIPSILFEPKGPLLPVFRDQRKRTSWSSLFAPGVQFQFSDSL